MLILGESGTGKELLARALHDLSPRKERRFVAINCAAIPENLLESELFGYEKGAYTGAAKQTIGKFETADSGTLFLDEIGDLPLTLQAKLLRFLQERVIERVGGRQEIPVDVRIVCATHQSLKDQIAAGKFREDLYYRLAEIVVEIPPLRDRQGDAALLAHAFVRRLAAEQRRGAMNLLPDAIDAIESHRWPGNVRELENVIKRAVIMSDGPMIAAKDLGLSPQRCRIRRAQPAAGPRRSRTGSGPEGAGPRQRQSQQGGGIARRQPSHAVRPHAPLRTQVSFPVYPFESPPGTLPSCDCPTSSKPPLSSSSPSCWRACNRADTASYITSAKSYIAKSDYKAAIIELKNALLQSPNSGEARFLMASSLLATGDSVGAETEARKALDLKYAPDETYPLLAKALLRQGDFRRLVSELGPVKLENERARADLDSSLGIAYLSLGEQKGARTSIDAALAANPKDVRARIVRARLTAQDKDLPQAQKLVDDVLADKPGDIDALLLKSELELVQGKRDDAIKTLEHAIEMTPDDIRPRAAVISLLVQSRKLDQAAAQLEGLKKVAPAQALTFYSDALVSSARGDQAHAKEAIQQVLKVAPDHLPSLYLAGIINYQSGAYAAAEDALRKVLARVPEERNARQVLAATYLRTGRPTQALEVLEPALRRAQNEPRVLRTAAEAYLALNDPIKATEYFEKANALDKGNVAGQVELAQVRLATGDTERALRDLEAISKADTSSYTADLALVSAYLRRHDFDKALAAVSALEKKQPAAPLPYSLKGTVYLAKGDTKAARASFEKALEVDPAFFNAAYNLARLDIADRNIEAARKRYSQMLVKDPNSETLLLAQAELLAATGASQQEVAAAIERAVAANPTSARARLALIGFLVQKRDTKAALAAAQAAQAALPDNPQILNALGVNQVLAHENTQALETFKRLAQLQPQSALPLLKVAEVQLVSKDYDGAIDTLRQAIALQPDLADAWPAMAMAYVAAGRPESAVMEGRKYQQEKPDRAVGYAIEGEAHGLQKQWAESAVSFQEALARQPLPTLAVRRYGALQNAGKTAEATAMAEKWFKSHPNDIVLRAFIAQQNLAKKDYPAAVRQYEAALEVEPNNTLFLNNLAWMLNELGDPKAQKYAQRAYDLAPTNASVLDTLGWILVQHGDAAKGVELLKAAAAVAPGQNEIRLHLAKALLKTGDKAGAKNELEALAKLEGTSPARDEAQKLLKEL